MTVEAVIRAGVDANKPDRVIALELNCSRSVVQTRRKALGLRRPLVEPKNGPVHLVERPGAWFFHGLLVDVWVSRRQARNGTMMYCVTPIAGDGEHWSRNVEVV